MKECCKTYLDAQFMGDADVVNAIYDEYVTSITAKIGELKTSLAAKDWKPCAFTLPGSDTPVNVLSVPFNDGPGPRTVYLLPSNDSKAFFRVRAE